MRDLDLSKYQRLFQWRGGGLPFLFSDIYMQFYRTLDCLIISSNGTWTNYIPKEIVKKTLDDGVEMAKNSHVFSQFVLGFEDLKKEVDKLFEEIYKNKDVSKEELERLIKLMGDFFVYYSKTEFFYTDKAYEGALKDSSIKVNVDKFNVIKDEWRAYLNKIFLGSSSYYSKVQSIISEKYSIPEGDLQNYSVKETISIFDGNIVDPNDISNRKLAFIMFGSNEGVDILAGKEAQRIAQSLQSVSTDVLLSRINGIIANKGLAKGRVKNIHYGYENFDELSVEIDKMEKGAILVAESTSPELLSACKKAGAIVTNQGGLMSHAAIVSREMKIPCIVGTQNATDILKDGMEVEVDADNGVVRIL